MRGITLLLTLMMWLLVNDLYAQLEDGEWYYGFKAGAISSKINDVSTTIIPSFFPQESYDVFTEPRLGFTGSFYVHHRFNRSRLAIQPELSYTQGGGMFRYSDVESLEYTIGFKYSYFNIAPILKLYLAHGLHFNVAPRLSFGLQESNLTYVSNQPELGPDLQIQQSLREVLKGKNNFNVLIGLGYDMPFGLSLGFEYHIGFSDVIETQANGFYFIENKNATAAYQVTLGYAIPFYNN